MMAAFLALAGCSVVFPFSAQDAGPGADAPRDSAPIDQRRVEATAIEGWHGAWAYRKRLVAAPAGGDKDLAGFVLLVSLHHDADLAAHASSADQLRFVAEDGVTTLAHDVERFTPASGALVAWVRLPTLRAGAPTELYLYFGDGAGDGAPSPEQVWAGKELVLHGGSEPETSSAGRNAAAPAAPATVTGAAPASGGRIAGAIAFDAPDDNVSPADGAVLLDGWPTFHVSFWFYLSYATDAAWVGDNEAKLIEKWDALSAGRTYRRATDAPGDGNFQIDVVLDQAGYQYLHGGVRRQTWQHVAVDFDQQQLVLYINGVAVHDVTAPGDRLASSTNALTLGSTIFGWRSFIGMLDEVRVGRESHGAARIAAEHANQAAPATFVGVGSLEALSPDA